MRQNDANKTMITPARLYGAERWAAMKRQEERIEMNDIMVLRWMCRVTRKDKIRNENMRDSGGGFQTDQGETIEPVRAHDEER